uniref:SET domain-containing protein n=1 Tax=Timema poppense TaxID=170557 RepID=A0A7R9GZF0_TIMPO|nr:unnamed protein product [Timema poppensis]
MWKVTLTQGKALVYKQQFHLVCGCCDRRTELGSDVASLRDQSWYFHWSELRVIKLGGGGGTRVTGQPHRHHVLGPRPPTTRLVRGTFSVVGQATSATIVPSTAGGRRNGTFIPLTGQADDSMNLIVQLGTTVVSSATPQVPGKNSTMTFAGRNITYRDSRPGGQGVMPFKGNTAVQMQAHPAPAATSPTQQVAVVTMPKPSTVVEPILHAVKEEKVDIKVEVKTEVEEEHETKHEYENPLTAVFASMCSKEQRLELVKLLLQDHNYGAPPPATPPLSPHRGPSGLPSSLCNSYTLPGGMYPYDPRLHRTDDDDDDANSVISSNPGREGEPEGEETETAPEGEDEDSVTRCICDFQHDDGYMICCDKCFVWQHVDCMEIDRNNIPELYSCERCQPRKVDKQRARTLQLRKREELLHLDSSTDSTSSSSPDFAAIGRAVGSVSGKKRSVALLSSGASRRKSEPAPSSFHKPIPSAVKKLAAASSNGGVMAGKQRQRRESAKEQRRASLGQARKKDTSGKETKKAPTMRRKSKSRPVVSDDDSDDDRPTPIQELRQWIDHYEEAVTNHYSPELRARISSVKVNGIHSDLKLGSVPPVPKCRVSILTTGLRILIATAHLSSNQPIIELRGKYMLSAQLGGTNHHGFPAAPNNRRNRLPPGPYIFFYRLPKEGTEVCVDTTTYGNDARFVRRSCQPNAEVRHCIEKGTLHLYLVAIGKLDKNSEITISHEQYHESTGLPRMPCACGNLRECRIQNCKKNGAHEAIMSEGRRERRRRVRRMSTGERVDSIPSHQFNPVSNVPLPPPPPPPQQVKLSTPTKISAPAKICAPAKPSAPAKLSPPTKSSTHLRSPNKQRERAYSPPEDFTSVTTERATTRSSTEASRELASSATATTSPATNTSSPSTTNHPLTDTTTASTNSHSEDSNKKLSREDRKMAAILKAIERMEQQSQKKEGSQSRPPQRRESEPPRAQAHHESKKPSAERPRKKKRRGRGRSNSGSQSATRRRTRLNSVNSIDSEGSSDEEVMSPTKPAQKPPLEEEHQDSPGRGLSTAAGLLLALANATTPQQNPSSSYQPHTSPPLSKVEAIGGVNPTLFSSVCDSGATSSSSQGSTPPTPLSSACLLVAAAVGPLAPGFKFPKTKKALMNEWLTQSPIPSELKVDNAQFSPNKCLVQGQGPMRPGGSAKKRWLRQAISEEGEAGVSPSSPRTGSPPCPDYVTPLKKRRLARESMSSEHSVTPPTTPTLTEGLSPTEERKEDIHNNLTVSCEDDDASASAEERGEYDKQATPSPSEPSPAVHKRDKLLREYIGEGSNGTEDDVCRGFEQDEQSNSSQDPKTPLSPTEEAKVSVAHVQETVGSSPSLPSLLAHAGAKRSGPTTPPLLQEYCIKRSRPMSPPCGDRSATPQDIADEEERLVSTSSQSKMVDKTERVTLSQFSPDVDCMPRSCIAPISPEGGGGGERSYTPVLLSEAVAKERRPPPHGEERTTTPPMVTTSPHSPSPPQSRPRRFVRRKEEEELEEHSVDSSATTQPAKRKLSISEYRQRKQRNSGSDTAGPGQGGDCDQDGEGEMYTGRQRSNSTSSSSSTLSSDLEETETPPCIPLLYPTTEASITSSEDKKTLGEDLNYIKWNSAPTLVERQRENLTERLRREFGLFLSDDEEQERVRKQNANADSVKDGIKKKAPPPPPPPPPHPPPDPVLTLPYPPSAQSFCHPPRYPPMVYTASYMPPGGGYMKAAPVSNFGGFPPRYGATPPGKKPYLLPTPAGQPFGTFGTGSNVPPSRGTTNPQGGSTFYTAAAAKAYYPPPSRP